MVLLLGYALVEVPRGLWNASKPGYTLNYSYFKVAKLSLDKCEAEETVDDILEVIKYFIYFTFNYFYHYLMFILFFSLYKLLQYQLDQGILFIAI